MVKRPKLPNLFMSLARPGGSKYYNPSKGEDWEKAREKAARRPTTLASSKSSKTDKK